MKIDLKMNLDEVVKDIDRSVEILESEKKKALEKIGLEVEHQVVQNIDTKKIIDTGKLKQSIHHVVEENAVIVADGVHYGCVFNAHTFVSCEKNIDKRIGQIKVGDKVLTQDGQYHKVIATQRYLAIEKPYLTELIIEYRKNKNHKLILTQDHKVLIEKNGCTYWIEAKDLKVGDLVFSPHKRNYNINTCLKAIVKCKHCGEEFKVRVNDLKFRSTKFCSKKCQYEGQIGEDNPNYGNKYSEETKKYLSEVRKKIFDENPDLHPNRIVSKKGFMSDCEVEIKEWLDSMDIEYEMQKYINGKVVDFFIPSLKMIIEADGAFWHQNQEEDIERDKILLEEYPDFKIFHFHFVDKRFSKIIDENPIENVYYAQCNSSFNSFVELERFKKVEILSVKNYKYENKSKNLGHKGHYLYDLTVEGMHSFIASGILISNSYNEFGTIKMSPRPFLRPAPHQKRGEIQLILREMVENSMK